MPLKITNPSKEVAVLNRWADTIDQQIRKLNTHVLNKAGFSNTTPKPVAPTPAPVVSGGIPTFTVVPTISGKTGDLGLVTNGSVGDTLYTYTGSYTGLPLVVNRGSLAIVAAGDQPITLLRPVVSGNLLIAVCFQFSSSTFSQTLGSGWSVYTTSSGPSPSMQVALRSADGSEGSAVSPWTGYTGTTYNGNIVFVVEIYNYNASPNFAFGGTSSTLTAMNITGITNNELALFFTGTNGFLGGPPVIEGLIPLGNQYLTGAYNPCYAFGLPLINPVVGTGITVMRGWDEVTSNSSVILVLKNSATAVNFWRPIG